MIVNRIHNNSDEEVEFVTGDAIPSVESDSELYPLKKPDKNLMLLRDWIDSGMMEQQTLSTKESMELSSSSNMTDLTDTITSSMYTFPQEKVYNLLKHFYNTL